MVPPEKHGGRPREVDIREVVNAILYRGLLTSRWNRFLEAHAYILWA
jgi:hypothetical protein